MNHCPTCKRTLDETVETCPRCGSDLSTATNRHFNTSARNLSSDAVPLQIART